MGLIDRFNRLVGRLQPGKAKTTSDEVVMSRMQGSVLKQFTINDSRRGIVEDCRAMYEADPRARGVISTLARDAVKGGFRVSVDDARAQAVADDLIERLGLFKRLDDWVRLTLRDGDSFLELSVDAGGQVAAVTRKPTLTMHRFSNDVDLFDDPRHAYWQGDAVWGGEAPPRDAIWFADWQMVHARWGHDEGSRYGRPLFGSARKAFRRMSEGETDIAVRRKTRAGMKYIHVIEGASEGEIEAYKERNQDVLDNPFAAIADFFTNKASSIQTVQGDARLSEIDDVLHHVETWAIASPVPLTLLGYGKDLNRDILEQKLAQYERALETVTEWVTDALVRPLLERQWLLMGIWSGGFNYDITWASKATLTAVDVKDAAEAGLRLRALGITGDEALGVIAPLMPGVDVAALRAAVAARQANEPDEVVRMAHLAGGVE